MSKEFHFVGVLLSLCALTLAGCAMAPAPIAVNKNPIVVPAGMATKSILLTKVVTNIPLGERVLNVYYSWWRMPGNSVGWRGGRLNLTDEELTDSFRHELTQSNHKVVGDTRALFDYSSALDAELLVAGSIEKVETNVWFPFASFPNIGVNVTEKLEGSTYIQVRWQIYSRDDEKVIYEVTTEGSYKSDVITTGSVVSFWKQAFSANVRNLLADPAFLAISRATSSKEAILPI